MVPNLLEDSLVHTGHTFLVVLEWNRTRRAHQTRLKIQQTFSMRRLFGGGRRRFGTCLLFYKCLVRPELFTVLATLLENVHEFISNMRITKLSFFVWIKVFITIDIEYQVHKCVDAWSTIGRQIQSNRRSCRRQRRRRRRRRKRKKRQRTSTCTSRHGETFSYS